MRCLGFGTFSVRPDAEIQAMETPASERKAAISAIGAVNSASKSGKGNLLASATKTRGGGRRALLDVTNDSPIVGLAVDRDEIAESPASITKRCPHPESVQTPGTGEALLRYQVKSLLQRVEAEAAIKAPSLRTLCHLNGFVASPSRLLAPTPANTPDTTGTTNSFTADDNILLTNESDPSVDLDVDLGRRSNTKSSAIPPEENSPFPEVMEAAELAKAATSPDKPITRALLFDSPEKNDAETSLSSPRSVISSEGDQKVGNAEDDDVSEWSMQVNVSSPGPEEEEEEGEIIEDGECEALCEGLRKVSVDENGDRHLNGIPGFAGKHTRFVYNSDDEFDAEVVSDLPSPSVVRLKGVPTPNGKHLRFSEDDDAGSENAPN